jgi:hypothetical protein
VKHKELAIHRGFPIPILEKLADKELSFKTGVSVCVRFKVEQDKALSLLNSLKSKKFIYDRFYPKALG